MPRFEVRIRGFTGLDEGDEASPFQCGVRRNEREEDAPVNPAANPRDKKKSGKKEGVGSSSSKKRKVPDRPLNWPLSKPTRHVRFRFFCSSPTAEHRAAAASGRAAEGARRPATGGVVSSLPSAAERASNRRVAACY